MKNARPSSQLGQAGEGRRRQGGVAALPLAASRSTDAVQQSHWTRQAPGSWSQRPWLLLRSLRARAHGQADMSVSSMSAVAGLLLVAGDGDGDHYTTFTVQARPNVP